MQHTGFYQIFCLQLCGLLVFTIYFTSFYQIILKKPLHCYSLMMSYEMFQIISMIKMSSRGEIMLRLSNERKRKKDENIDNSRKRQKIEYFSTSVRKEKTCWKHVKGNRKVSGDFIKNGVYYRSVRHYLAGGSENDQDGYNIAVEQEVFDDGKENADCKNSQHIDFNFPLVEKDQDFSQIKYKEIPVVVNKDVEHENIDFSIPPVEEDKVFNIPVAVEKNEQDVLKEVLVIEKDNIRVDENDQGVSKEVIRKIERKRKRKRSSEMDQDFNQIKYKEIPVVVNKDVEDENIDFSIPPVEEDQVFNIPVAVEKNEQDVLKEVLVVEKDNIRVDENDQGVSKEVIRKIERKRKRKRSSEMVKTEEKENHPILPSCECTIRNCSLNINEERRNEIHALFWSLTYNERRNWIIHHMKVSDVKRRYFVGAADSRRNNSRIFLFPGLDENSDISVCKKMFLSTLGYKCDSALTTAANCFDKFGVNHGDKRGRNEPANKLSGEKLSLIKDHIMSFNPTISHYRREHAPNRLYLPSYLSIIEMYDDYEKQCVKHNLDTVKYDKYAKVVSSLNISFAKLGDERCETCEEHKVHIKESTDQQPDNDSDRKRKRLEGNKILRNFKDMVCKEENCDSCKNFSRHNQCKNDAREAYENDKKKVSIISELPITNELFLSADMQKVILLPRLPGFKLCIFTKRVVVINESFAPILNKGTKSRVKALGVLWHEAIMGRNDEDVASAFIKAMQSSQFRDYKHFIIWLDNCAGQNKNWTLITALTQFVNQSYGPQSITLKFFTKGHTFMSADSFHKRIEDAMRRMYEVCDWHDFVSCVSEAGTSIEMTSDDFYAFESRLSSSQNSRNGKPLLDDVVVGEFRKGSTSWFFKRSHKDEDFQEHDFLLKKVVQPISQGKFVIGRKRPRGICASKKKVILEKLCPLMPVSRKVFFEELIENQDSTDLCAVI